MPHVYLVPPWFLGYDVALQVTFAVITIIVSLYAFKVYKLSGQKQSKLFAIAFFLISMAYFVQSFVNYSIIERLDEGISRVIQLRDVFILNYIGLYTHIALFITALVILSYMTLRIKSKKTFSLLLVLSFFLMLVSSNKFYAYYILSSILLIYITLHYLFNYLQKRQGKTLMVLIAFIFLLFGSIQFIFSVEHELYYVIAHSLEMIAYILILINLILVVKR